MNKINIPTPAEYFERNETCPKRVKRKLPEVETHIRDNCMAILIADSNGMGWSHRYGINIAIDKRIIEAFISAAETCTNYREVEVLMMPLLNTLGYTVISGIFQLRLEWIPCGSAYRVDEYDGDETLVVITELNIAGQLRED